MTSESPQPSRAIEYLSEVTGACALDQDGELMGLYQVGHWPPWELRQEARWEHGDGYTDPGWPRREWWLQVPYSLAHPGEPPCGDGPEIEVFEKVKRSTPYAFPVTVLYFD